MPDFTTYQAPGVFVEEDLTALVNVIGIEPAVVAIVGPGRGFQLATETVSFADGNDVDLLQTLVDESTVVVTAADGTVYDITDDYTLATASGVTTITWVSGGDIPAGGTVFVAYQYTPPDYYSPLRVRDFDDATAAFGPPIDLTTGEIFSPLTFAARVAFQHGARELVLVATPGDLATPVTLQELEDAYGLLLSVFDVDLIVPLPVGITGTEAAPGDTQTVGTDLRQHLLEAADDGLFRMGILGYESTVTISPTTTASAISSSRVVLAWPSILRYYHGFTNTTIDVSGYYLAAAYAGRLASLPVQTPLTHKRVDGFAGFTAATLQEMTNATKNAWSSGGVAVTERTRDNIMRVRHGVTTDRTNINTREISLVRAKDALIDLVKGTVDAAELVGSWIEEETPGRVKGVVAGALEAAVDTGVIVEYNNLKARQLTSDPSVIEVKFQYKPAYPLNYIVIKFSINTETGQVTTEEEA